ncbi:MAG: antitoxin [Acidobacteriota bacterium]
MSTRVQIVIDEEEARRLRRCAERAGLTLSEWARRALRRAETAQEGPSPEQKCIALEAALECDYPTGEIEQILSEIEGGRDLH